MVNIKAYILIFFNPASDRECQICCATLQLSQVHPQLVVWPLLGSR